MITSSNDYIFLVKFPFYDYILLWYMVSHLWHVCFWCFSIIIQCAVWRPSACCERGSWVQDGEFSTQIHTGQMQPRDTWSVWVVIASRLVSLTKSPQWQILMWRCSVSGAATVERVCMWGGETGVQIGMEEPVFFLLHPHLQTEALRPDNRELRVMVEWGDGGKWGSGADGGMDRKDVADASVFCEVNHESEFYTALSKYTLRNWIYLFRSQFFDKHNASCWII